MFVEMQSGTVKIEDAGHAAGLAPGAFVLHAVTEVDADAVAGLTQT